jgi:hypothetical protein
VSAGANSINVDDRTIFEVGEKFRILSQDADDWSPNESRTSPEVDLDPEEIATEELVVQSITAGTGNAGTITFTTNLQFSYKTGAIIGEDPRPCGASSRRRQIDTSAEYDVMGGDNSVWLPVYNVCDAPDIPNHMNHRQMWRTVHQSADKNAPYEYYLTSYGGARSSMDINVGGDDTTDSIANFTVQNNRPVFGLNSLLVFVDAYTANGIYPYAKGVIDGLWWAALDNSGNPPDSAVEEDTYKARWGSSYEEFRLFKQRGSTATWAVFGPEIS